MNIFRIYLCLNFIKTYYKSHQIALFKKFIRGTCPRPPPPYQALRAMQLAKTLKSWALANPAYAHEIRI